MTTWRFLSALVLVSRLFAVEIPSGTELSIRLTGKVASETPAPHPEVHAVLIAPVIVNGNVALAAGAELTGSVKQAKAATDKDPAQLQIVFTAIAGGANARQHLGGHDGPGQRARDDRRHRD